MSGAERAQLAAAVAEHGGGAAGGGADAAAFSSPPARSSMSDSKTGPRGNRVHPEGKLVPDTPGTVMSVGTPSAFGSAGQNAFRTPSTSPTKEPRGSRTRRGSLSRRRRSSLADQRKSLAEAREQEQARLAAMTPARERWHNAVGVVRECVRLRRRYVARDPEEVAAEIAAAEADGTGAAARRRSKLADTISQLVEQARRASEAGSASGASGTAALDDAPREVREAERKAAEEGEGGSVSGGDVESPTSKLNRLREQNKSLSDRFEDKVQAYEACLMRTPGCRSCCPTYRSWMDKVKGITETNIFKSTIMGFIVLASIMVGVQTYPLPQLALDIMVDVLEPLVQWAFVVELVMKLLGEGTRFWVYFQDGWNCFDFLIVVSSFLPIGGSNVTILRLLRLLRVLKLVKALPQLQLLVMSLLNSLSSIGYISLLMGLQFYLYAVLGVIAFGEIDPVYFGDLHSALVSLWQAATGDDWSDHLYTASYGCGDPKTPDYAYSIEQNALRCQQSGSGGVGGGLLMPTLYYVSFQILAGLMLLNLFVGAIMMAVQEAKEEVASGEVLTVYCVRAEDLRAADIGVAGFGGASDPYVVANIGDQVNKTKVKKNTLNPEWGESFDFWPLDELGSTLTLRVFDWDRFGSDDILGHFHLHLDNLVFDREYTFRCELSGEQSSGFLTIRVLKHTTGSSRAEGANRSAVERIQDSLWEAEELLGEIADLNKVVKAKQRLARRKVPSLKTVASSFKKLGSTRSLISQASDRSGGLLSRLSGKRDTSRPSSIEPAEETKAGFSATTPPGSASPTKQSQPKPLGMQKEAPGRIGSGSTSVASSELPGSTPLHAKPERSAPVSNRPTAGGTRALLAADSDMDLIAALNRPSRGGASHSLAGQAGGAAPGEPQLKMAESDFDLLADYRSTPSKQKGDETTSGLGSVAE